MKLGAHTKRNLAVGAAVAIGAGPAIADEGGVGFWLPGQMGSFAAVPSDPGWSVPIVYYYSAADAGADVAFPRRGRTSLGIDAKGNLALVFPTYVFASPVAAGQLSLGVGVGGGVVKADVNATITGPGGNTISGSEGDRRNGFADLYPMATLKWNHEVNNYMAYLAAGAPLGSYSADRLANTGTNHWALDAGGGYTYLDPKARQEFSAVLGFTYNFKNNDTNYRNGVDMHLDWAASYFVTPQVHAGPVGYYYQQLSGDSGSGATLGDFKSRVAALGPQVGYFFDVGGRKWYANAKAYWEFGAKNRAEGWNFWLSVAIPLGGKP
jgi:hypothetical protein